MKNCYVYADGSPIETIHSVIGNDLIGTYNIVSGVKTHTYFLKDHLGSIKVRVNEQGETSYDDYDPYGYIMDMRSSSTGEERFKFTGKERDVETGYDYFGARYYDARIGRWLQVDPLAEKYPGWSPYNYVMNNPIVVIDPTGRDSTFYLKQQTTKVNDTQLKEMKNQVVSILDQTGIPMKVSVLKQDEFSVLDPTDVQITIADDSHPVIKRTKSNKPDAEGMSPVGSQEGIVTVEAMERKGLSEIGLGNIISHEGFHAVGIREHTPKTLMSEEFSPMEINNPKQSLDDTQKQTIHKFLSKEKVKK